ncbi:MAG: hypothetical protein ACFE95_07520 [Candidatus Hodarchaeota archaeon]
MLIQAPNNNNIKREKAYPNKKEIQNAKIVLISGSALIVLSAITWSFISPLGSFVVHLTQLEWLLAAIIGSVIFSFAIFLDQIGAFLYNTFKLKNQSIFFLKPYFYTFIHIYWYISAIFIAGTSLMIAGGLNTNYIIVLTILFLPIIFGRLAFRAKRVQCWFLDRMNFFKKLQDARDNVTKVLIGESTPQTNSSYFSDGYFDFDVNILEKRDFLWLETQIKNAKFVKESRLQIAQTIYPDDPQGVSDLMNSTVN